MFNIGVNVFFWILSNFKPSKLFLCCIYILQPSNERIYNKYNVTMQMQKLREIHPYAMKQPTLINNMLFLKALLRALVSADDLLKKAMPANVYNFVKGTLYFA